VTKLGLDAVLRDRTAYLLFYARDDPGKARPPTTNGIHKSPSIAASDKINGTPPSPGSKRPLNGESTPESPKRRKVTYEISDDDDDVEFVKPAPPKSRKPFGNVNSTSANSPSLPNKLATYGKPPVMRPTSSPQPPYKPYSPKAIPLKSKFFEELNKNKPVPIPTTPPAKPSAVQPSKPPTQEPQTYRADKPRRPTQLETTTQNPSLGNDPFVEGFVFASINQQANAVAKHTKPGLKYYGIQSQFHPGANALFDRDFTGKKKSVAQQRDQLGIKTNRDGKNNRQ
jgi:hypothetical protein